MLGLVKRWAARLPALVAVGTLGVVAPAGAQSPFCPTPTCSRTVASVIVAEGPSAARVGEVPERFQEIRVELVWLANGTTFPWPLRAHADRSQLEVRGEVPDEATRQEAVRLARLSTSLPVVDELHVRPAMRPARPPSGVGGDVMVRGVMGVLREVLGDRAVRVKMGMRAGGQVTLRGVVSCYEEKLAISARIRRVPGCACVVNELTVPPTMHDGRAVLPVSADGSKVVSVLPVSAEGPKRVSVLPVPIQPADTPYRAATWSVPAAAQPQTAPSRPQEVKQSRPAAPMMPPASEAGSAVRPLPPLPAAPPAVAPAPVVPAGKSPVMPKGTNRPLPNSTVQPVAHFDATGPADPQVLPAPSVPSVSATRGAPAPSSRPSLSEPAKASRTPARTGPRFAQDRTASTEREARPTTPAMSPPQSDIPDLHWPKVVHDEALPLPGKHLAAGPDITTAPMSSVTQAPRSLPSGVSSKPQKPEPSQPIRPSDSVKVPASPAMPRSLPAPPMPKRPAQAVIQPPKPAVPDKPYVSTALVTFEDEPATPPVKPAKMAAPVIPIGVAMSPLELQQRVLRVCAGATRDVQVTMQADRRWEVKVKVPTAALKEVSAKIMQLPDMAQPHVRLKLEISE